MLVDLEICLVPLVQIARVGAKSSMRSAKEELDCCWARLFPLSCIEINTEQYDSIVATFGEGMRRGQFDEGDLEFFRNEALKEAGVERTIARARMVRRIRDRFKSASSSATGVTQNSEQVVT